MTATTKTEAKKLAVQRGNSNALRTVRQRQIDRSIFDFNAKREVPETENKKWQQAGAAFNDLEEAWPWTT